MPTPWLPGVGRADPLAVAPERAVDIHAVEGGEFGRVRIAEGGGLVDDDLGGPGALDAVKEGGLEAQLGDQFGLGELGTRVAVTRGAKPALLAAFAGNGHRSLVVALRAGPVVDVLVETGQSAGLAGVADETLVALERVENARLVEVLAGFAPL